MFKLARVKSRVNRLVHFVNNYKLIESACKGSRFSLNILCRLLNIEISTRLELVRSEGKLFLVVYQRDSDTPDYTIELKEIGRV